MFLMGLTRDAKGARTTVTVAIGEVHLTFWPTFTVFLLKFWLILADFARNFQETFTASGLMITERNFLDV
jgi:hypothetical protein